MDTYFKTPKGTELPFLNLKGKQYLQVQHRLVWFREEKPDWSIETEFLVLTDKASVAKATIKDPAGRILATATKKENQEHFNDFTEKSESGAVGRALAFLGYGTSFAQELEEEERVVDTPLPKAVSKSSAPTVVNNKAQELIEKHNPLTSPQVTKEQIEQIRKIRATYKWEPTVVIDTMKTVVNKDNIYDVTKDEASLVIAMLNKRGKEETKAKEAKK